MFRGEVGSSNEYSKVTKLNIQSMTFETYKIYNPYIYGIYVKRQIENNTNFINNLIIIH
jgi:hypothetical protein